MADNRYNKRNRGARKQGSGKRPLTETDVYRTAATPYRRKRFGGASMAVVLCAVLLVSTLAASAWHIATMERPQTTKKEDIAESLNAEKETVETAAEAKFESLVLTSDDVHTGDLVLVNYEYEYIFPADEGELVNVYQNKTDNYSVAYNYYVLDGDVLNVFSAMMGELLEVTGDSCILVNSTYRSFEDQQNIYNSYLQSNGEEYTKNYVADPGHSEHHTGLALDLTIRYPDGTYVLMKNYENLGVLNTLCVEYGFIQRYPENKYYYTHINTEPWHYRYVGVPHAYVIAKKSLCLEEYMDFIKDYTVDGEMLLINEAGEFSTCSKTNIPENGYLIYYIPENAAGSTEIAIPEGCTDYTVSGNNCDGFVVTVLMGEVALPEASFPLPSDGVQ